MLILSIAGCRKKPDTFVNNGTTDSILKDKPGHFSKDNIADKGTALKYNNEQIVKLLKDKQYDKLADFIHPEKGVRFSMYAFISLEEDKVFSKPDFLKYQPTETIFIWGAMDGSGELYQATINEYLTNWVYSKDFAATKVSFNEFQGGGNSLNNLKKIYPNADFTENYIKGSGHDAETDWKCLRLVFDEFQGTYYLVGIINDQWTI